MSLPTSPPQGFWVFRVLTPHVSVIENRVPGSKAKQLLKIIHLRFFYWGHDFKLYRKKIKQPFIFKGKQSFCHIVWYQDLDFLEKKACLMLVVKPGEEQSWFWALWEIRPRRVEWLGLFWTCSSWDCDGKLLSVLSLQSNSDLRFTSPGLIGFSCRAAANRKTPVFLT